MENQLEICVTSVVSAVTAAESEAQRVELCDNLWEGGTTPSAGMISSVREAIGIGLFVIIRPRGGDFIYSDAEFKVMKADIVIAKELGADGIVSGVLRKDGTIDIDRTKELVELSKPLPFTFHRAFDCVADAEQAIEDVIQTGSSRILTSGLASKAVDGIEVLTKLQADYGTQIQIMIGGGVTSENIAKIANGTKCQEFHMTGKKWQKSSIEYDNQVRMNGLNEIPENDYLVASPSDIKQVKAMLDLM
jgi:copper homeostasis protein